MVAPWRPEVENRTLGNTLMADALPWLAGAPADPSGGLSGSDLKQLATNSSQMLVQMGNLIQALTNLLPFSGAIGSFTSTAGSTTTVADATVQATSHIDLTPTNAAAATLDSAATAYYVSARTVGVSFTLTTANAGAAAGTETWTYQITNASA